MRRIDTHTTFSSMGPKSCSPLTGASQCLVGQLPQMTSKGGLGSQAMGWVVRFSNQPPRVGWGTRIWVARAEAKAQSVAGFG